MKNSIAVIISPNYKDYATQYLQACVESLRAQTLKQFDIFLVDNETSNSSYALLQQLVPEAIILTCVKNEGFAGGNNVALERVIEDGYEYVFLLNMDTIVAPDCLAALVQALDSESQAGAIQARLMLYPEQELVNSLGNEIHFLGFGYSRGYKELYVEKNQAPWEIAYPSGAAVLLRVSALKKIGCFDEELWMYNEDQDLGWRLWLAGFRCLLAPQAIVYHKYNFSRSIQKYYWLDRNRIIVILKNYHWLTLLLISPAFFIMEVGLILFALRGGYIKEKLHVWGYFFSIARWRQLLRKRRKIQKQRKVAEKNIIFLITGRIWYQEIGGPLLKIANIFLGLYWRLVKSLVRW